MLKQCLEKLLVTILFIILLSNSQHYSEAQRLNYKGYGSQIVKSPSSSDQLHPVWGCQAKFVNLFLRTESVVSFLMFGWMKFPD